MRILVATFLAAFAAGTGLAAGERGGEIGAHLGAAFTDENLSMESGGTVEPALGLWGGTVFADRWTWFFDVTRIAVSTGGSVLGDAETYWARTGLEYTWRAPNDRSRWFLTGGYGIMVADFDDVPDADFDRPFVSGSVGKRFLLGGRRVLRFEARGDVTVGDEGLGEEVVGQGLLLAGFVWGAHGGGGPTAADADGDGVRDRRDRCLGTPAGLPVDRRGCPTDGDDDGIADDADRCPGTRSGTAVGPDGCPTDSDGDGVADITDACAATPEGTEVDDWGCPYDRDRDGVPEGADLCPRTLPGVRVDIDGCALDGDGDGVPDGLDQCPDSPPGVEVGRRGCPASRYEFDAESGSVRLWLDFDTGRATLDETAGRVLDELSGLMRANPASRFEIGGHTDATGREEDNLELSERRAIAVRDYLVEAGIAPARLRVRGYGSSRPIAPNDTVEGRRLNRRIEMTQLP